MDRHFATTLSSNYNLHNKSNKNDLKTPLIIVAGIALKDRVILFP